MARNFTRLFHASDWRTTPHENAIPPLKGVQGDVPQRAGGHLPMGHPVKSYQDFTLKPLPPLIGGIFTGGERGFTLAVVVVFTTVLLVGLSEAMINWQKAMQREREEELIFRGKQFIRAIELWQRKFPGTFPTTIDALLNTNNVRFLRKKWKDPITNSDEWRLIKLNPDGSIAGLTIIPSRGQSGTDLPGTPAQNRSGGFGSLSRRGGGSLGGATDGFQSSTQNPDPLRRTSTQTLGQKGPSQTSGSPVLGGIIGVASTSGKETLKSYNGRNKYNEWEFYYVPRLQLQPAAGAGQQPPGQRPGITPGAAGAVQPPSPGPAPQQQPAPGTFP